MTLSYSESFITSPQTAGAAVARLSSFCKVWSLDLAWWPDLARPKIETFTKVAKKMGDRVGENPAACSAAVFFLSAKNLRGVFKHPPPSLAKVKVTIPP